MTFLANLLAVFWALRWLLTLVAFAVLGISLAQAVHDTRRLRAEVAQLKDGNRRLVIRLRERRTKPQMIVGRVRL